MKIQTGVEWDLSEQEMIDCVNNVAAPGYGYYSSGCSGGCVACQWPAPAVASL